MQQNVNSMMVRLWVYCIVCTERISMRMSYIYIHCTCTMHYAHTPLLWFDFSGIPAIFACRKIGAGKVQIAGGVLCCLGLTCTAFTTAAWQALLINGVVTGISIRNFQGITPQGGSYQSRKHIREIQNRNNTLLAF